MPYARAAKRYKRRPTVRPKLRRWRRKRRTSRLGKPSRGLTQSTYMFKRRTTSVLPLDGSSQSGWTLSGDNGVYRNWVFTLGDITTSTEFTRLFRRYKINAVKVELAFSNTQSASTGGSQAAAPVKYFDNAQLQIYTKANRVGVTPLAATTEADFMETQAMKKRLALNGGKPVSFFMKVNQLAETYQSALPGGTDYAVQRPRYIGTNEPTCPHYGITMYINRVDGQPLGTGHNGQPQFVRSTVTYYLSFKGVA